MLQTKPLILALSLALLAPAPASAEEMPSALQLGFEAGKKKDWATALSQFKPLAEQGNAQAQFFLAEMYRDGLGVEQDRKQALEWLRMSAENGLPLAQFNLGNYYYLRHEGGEAFSEALKWWQPAADKGFYPAQYNLAILYHLGQGMPQDIEKAKEWYAKAAENGSDPAKQALERIAAGDLSPPSIKKPATPARTEGASNQGLEWILAQPTGNYTLQLFSGLQMENAISIAQKVKGRGQVVIFPFTHDGATWHAVILGSFPDAAAAKQAGERIKPLLGNEPWARSFASVHKLLPQK